MTILFTHIRSPVYESARALPSGNEPLHPPYKWHQHSSSPPPGTWDPGVRLHGRLGPIVYKLIRLHVQQYIIYMNQL